MLKSILALLLFCLPSLSRSEEAAKDPVMSALTKELDRSFAGLKNAEKVPLYYLGYELTVSKTREIAAKLGAIEYEAAQPGAILDIDVRVNSAELDNSHQVKGGGGGRAQQGSYQVSIEGGEDALRAKIWEHTDKAYKKALEDFTKVKMNKAVTAAEEDPSPDFSAVTPEKSYETAELAEPDLAAWKERLRKQSAYFSAFPFVYDSSLFFSYETENRYLVNSEGARVKTGRNYVSLSYSVTSRTTDGMDIRRSMNYGGDSFDDLPSEDKLAADMARSVKELEALKTAQVVEPYSGPAILSARAAALYFHEIIGHRLEGHRNKLEDSGQTFAKKVGQKITSDIITLYDDPTLKEYKGASLRGYYAYDNEGVRGQRASLIENGVLKGFLMNRSPIRGFTASNGHGRRSPGFPAVSRMGNLIVEATGGVPYAELRRLLIEECKKQGKPFGLIFDDISNGYTSTGRAGIQSFKVIPLLVYKVYTDGRPDEAVRGVNLVGTPIASFSKIAAAADDFGVFNGDCGAESGWVPVSAVSPSLLVSEIEVEKAEKSQQKPPVLNPPLHDK